MIFSLINILVCLVILVLPYLWAAYFDHIFMEKILQHFVQNRKFDLFFSTFVSFFFKSHFMSMGVLLAGVYAHYMQALPEESRKWYLVPWNCLDGWL